jgi:protein-S-isoprenylcysteine O-methyltransferase Ste14
VEKIARLKHLVLGRFILALAVLFLVLFLPAGTLRFWEAWVYLAVLFLPMAGGIAYFLKHNPDVLERRMKTKEKERVQKKFVLAGIILFAAAILIVGFDRRWNWSFVPLVLVIIADIMVALGYGIFVLVTRENRYLSRTVEVEMGQTVIATGPYAVVRHPMYVGVLLLYLFTPVALGSFWALIPFGILTALFPVRILNEEKVLLRDLDGYRAYTEKIRFRLIPGIW